MRQKDAITVDKKYVIYELKLCNYLRQEICNDWKKVHISYIMV